MSASPCLSYAQYTAGADQDAISGIAHRMSTQHGIPALFIEKVLVKINPVVCIFDQDSPAQSTLFPEDWARVLCLSRAAQHESVSL